MPQVDGQSNVVVCVQYKVSGTDGTHTASIDLSQQYTLEQSGAFTPYEQLTEAQVIGWIPAFALASAEACVDGQIASLANPPVSPSSQPLPWATP